MAKVFSEENLQAAAREVAVLLVSRSVRFSEVEQVFGYCRDLLNEQLVTLSEIAQAQEDLRN